MARKTVLVADDDRISRLIVKKNIEADYNILEAADGQEALAVLDRHPEIAVLLLDLVMPGLNGFEVLKALRQGDGSLRLPVIVITGGDDVLSQEKAFALGAMDVMFKPFSGAMLRHKVDNIVAVTESIRLQDELELQEQLVRAAEIDSLTGLWNKQTFCREAGKYFAAHPGREFVLSLWDLDRFKVYNENFGPAAGDRLIEDIGKVLAAAAQEIHFSSLILQGHDYGDHFLACWQADTFNEQALHDFVQQKLERLSPNYKFTVRLGLYLVHDAGVSVALMCDRALLALRSVKNSYDKHWAWYEDLMRRHILEEASLTDDMRTALEEGQFLPYFQPQYNYKTGNMIGVEALARWQHPTRGLLTPAKFIPVFEKNGFIYELDRYMWEASCKYLRRWLDLGLAVPSVSVNVSRTDLYRHDLETIFRNLILQYGLQPGMLRLEITESAYMDNPEQLVNTVSVLQQAGFLVDMDDFGTGYSSLNMLKQLPVDLLKLDMKFVANAEANKRSASILANVVHMTSDLSLPVLAEGVETRLQADYLEGLGCTYMQGYLFAKPMAPAELETLLRQAGVEKRLVAEGKPAMPAAGDTTDKDLELQKLLTVVPGGVFRYRAETGEIDYVSQNMLEMLGYTREEFRDKFANKFANMVYAEDRDRVLNEIRTDLTRTGGTDSCEYRIETKSGRLKWVFDAGRLYTDEQGRRWFVVVIIDIEEKRKHYGRLLHEAELDGLTRVYTRGGAERYINLRMTMERDNVCTFLLLDMDNLKGINDHLGHALGDAALQMVANQLKKHFRSSDIIGRMGGDEFVAFLPGLSNEKTLHRSIGELLHTLAGTYLDKEKQWPLSCSMGLAISNMGRTNFSTMYRQADTALYHVKRNGKGSFAIYNPQMQLKTETTQKQELPPATPK
jgi:diguanylate cyclase (GGDEF)-like protein/PAS domain S-box-containing protein